MSNSGEIEEEEIINIDTTEDKVSSEESLGGTSVEETPSQLAKEKPMTPETALKRLRRALNIEKSSETQVTSIANESVSSSPVTPFATPVLAENHTESGNESTQQKVLKEEKREDNGKKRKREHQDNTDLNENELASDQSPNIAPATTVLPFKKKSPYWKRYTSFKGFKSIPQKPHFSPLIEASNDIRDWSAVGMMVTYYMLLDEVEALKLDDPSRKLNEFSGLFAKLEKYGFDIAKPQGRIKKVLSLRDERAKKAEEIKCLENKIDADESEKLKWEEERAELKCKILELQREDRIAEEVEEATAKRIAEMKASASRIDQEIEDMKVEFEKTI